MDMAYGYPSVYGAPAMPSGPQSYSRVPTGAPAMPPGGQPYNGMPPAAPAYDRMGNGYSSMQGYDNAQQSYNNPPSPPGLKGWEVSCEEEARKALIDLDGSIFVFLDRQTGAIYTKQINPADYSPIFRVYRPEPLPQPAGSAPQCFPPAVRCWNTGRR